MTHIRQALHSEWSIHFKHIQSNAYFLPRNQSYQDQNGCVWTLNWLEFSPNVSWIKLAFIRSITIQFDYLQGKVSWAQGTCSVTFAPTLERSRTAAAPVGRASHARPWWGDTPPCTAKALRMRPPSLAAQTPPTAQRAQPASKKPSAATNGLHRLSANSISPPSCSMRPLRNAQRLPLRRHMPRHTWRLRLPAWTSAQLPPPPLYRSCARWCPITCCPPPATRREQYPWRAQSTRGWSEHTCLRNPSTVRTWRTVACRLRWEEVSPGDPTCLRLRTAALRRRPLAGRRPTGPVRASSSPVWLCGALQWKRCRTIMTWSSRRFGPSVPKTKIQYFLNQIWYCTAYKSIQRYFYWLFKGFVLHFNKQNSKSSGHWMVYLPVLFADAHSQNVPNSFTQWFFGGEVEIHWL